MFILMTFIKIAIATSLYDVLNEIGLSLREVVLRPGSAASIITTKQNLVDTVKEPLIDSVFDAANGLKSPIVYSIVDAPAAIFDPLHSIVRGSWGRAKVLDSGFSLIDLFYPRKEYMEALETYKKDLYSCASVLGIEIPDDKYFLQDKGLVKLEALVNAATKEVKEFDNIFCPPVRPEAHLADRSKDLEVKTVDGRLQVIEKLEQQIPALVSISPVDRKTVIFDDTELKTNDIVILEDGDIEGAPDMS